MILNFPEGNGFSVAYTRFYKFRLEKKPAQEGIHQHAALEQKNHQYLAKKREWLPVKNLEVSFSIPDTSSSKDANCKALATCRVQIKQPHKQIE